jgi:hypothetical protein
MNKIANRSNATQDKNSQPPKHQKEKRKYMSSECAFNEPSWNAVLMECPPSHQTKETHRKRRKPRGSRGVSNERRAKP